MIKNSEQTIPLNLIIPDNQIEKCFNLEDNIKTINRMGPYGNVALHVASHYEYNEVFQVLLTDSALQSLETNSSQSTLYDERKMNEIKKLFLKDFNLHDSQEEIPENHYIEWSSSGNSLIKKAKEFREKMDLYKTYNNQHYLVTKLLVEIIEYYLNEYLLQQEHFSKEETQNIENYFKKAIKEQNYFKYFIQAYTLTNNFHRVLNKHLALYILHYFDTSSYSSLRTKYRLINCLAHIVTLLINHPDIHNYTYKGITYRGLLMNENDLKCYSIGNYILNRSFVSTSKNRLVAQIFAGNRQANMSGETLIRDDLTQVPVLFRYTIKQNQTGIDIQHISMVAAEEEVLILPFSVFQIKDRIENCSNMCSPVLVEIDLEEYADNEQMNNKKQKNKSVVSLRHRTKIRKNVARLKWLYVTIGLSIMLSLIVAVGFVIKAKIKSSNEPQNEERRRYTQTNQQVNKQSQQSFEESTRSNRNNMTVVGNDHISWNQGIDAECIQNPGTIWKQLGITIAGGNGLGNQSNQLYFPVGIAVDDNQTVYIADYWNHRIVEWKFNAASGRILAGGNGEGNETNQLKYPIDVVIDQEENSLIISDQSNRRVIRWPRQNNTNGQIIISDIACVGLTMDKNGSLYVSDYEKNEVGRWKRGEKDRTIVAGGNGKGNHHNQLNHPTWIFVDDDYSLYVSDEYNHRVMKWMKGATEGIVVAGGNNQGNTLTQLSSPHGIIVDQFGQIYVADYYNHRVMRWCKGAKEGTIVVGGSGQQFNQLNSPTGLSFDRQGNLYVVDHWNHRIQKFEIYKNENNLFE